MDFPRLGNKQIVEISVLVLVCAFPFLFGIEQIVGKTVWEIEGRWASPDERAAAQKKLSEENARSAREAEQQKNPGNSAGPQPTTFTGKPYSGYDTPPAEFYSPTAEANAAAMRVQSAILLPGPKISYSYVPGVSAKEQLYEIEQLRRDAVRAGMKRQGVSQPPFPTTDSYPPDPDFRPTVDTMRVAAEGVDYDLQSYLGTCLSQKHLDAMSIYLRQMTQNRAGLCGFNNLDRVFTRTSKFVWADRLEYLAAWFLLMVCALTFCCGRIVSFDHGSVQLKFAACAALALGALYPITILFSGDPEWSNTRAVGTLGCACFAIFLRIGWSTAIKNSADQQRA